MKVSTPKLRQLLFYSSLQKWTELLVHRPLQVWPDCPMEPGLVSPLLKLYLYHSMQTPIRKKEFIPGQKIFWILWREGKKEVCTFLLKAGTQLCEQYFSVSCFCLCHIWSLAAKANELTKCPFFLLWPLCTSWQCQSIPFLKLYSSSFSTMTLTLSCFLPTTPSILFQSETVTNVG